MKFFLFFITVFSLASMKVLSQDSQVISLKFTLKQTIAFPSADGEFNLLISIDGVLKYHFNGLKPDTVIEIYRKENSVFKASVSSTEYSATDFSWKFDTLKKNFIKEIILKPKLIELKQVDIIAQRQPYKRGDTLVIPVDSIKTKPHADATELIEKIPGFSVNASGNVSVLGNKIDKVKVDGNEIFGGNPKATLENVKADMLKDVEVINAAHDSGGENEINLRLKKDKKEGVYGELYVQQGTSDSENLGFKLNSISPVTSLTSFFSYNNQNQSAISPADYVRLISFNNEALNTIGTQKLYYDFNINDPQNNPGDVIDKFSISQNGIHSTFNTGFNISTKYKNLSWNSYFLAYRDKSTLDENSDIISNLGMFTTDVLKNAINNNNDLLAVGQSNLKWSPDENDALSAKLTVQRRSEQLNPANQSNTSLFNNADSLLDESLTTSVQHINSYSDLLSLHGNWEHRYEKAAEKTTISGGVLISNTENDNNYNNDILTNSLPVPVNNNRVFEHTNSFNYFGAIQHNTPLSRKLLIDFRISSLFNENLTNNQGSDDINGSFFPNSALSVKNLQVHNNQIVAQSFLYYKSSSLSIIGGFGALNTSWKVSACDTLFNKVDKTTFLPAFYFNYSFTKSKISLRYIKEQYTPQLNNLLPITDSSNVQQVYKGNPLLSPYFTGKYELNSVVDIKGIGSVNLQLNYSITNLPVTNNYIFTTGVYPLTTYVQYKKVNEITGSVSYFNINQGKFLNLYFFVFYLWRHQYQLNQQIANPVEFISVNPLIGYVLTITKEHNLNFNIQSTFCSSQTSVSGGGISTRFNFELKDDNQINENLYYKFSAKWLFTYDNNLYSPITPIMSFNLYKYLGKEQNWQINAGANNLLNVKQIKVLSTGLTTNISSTYNYLPRYFSIGVTYYAEKWKKSKL